MPPAQLHRLLRAAPVFLAEQHPLPVRRRAAGGIERLPIGAAGSSPANARLRVGII
jgi:hypothetical protein